MNLGQHGAVIIIIKNNGKTSPLYVIDHSPDFTFKDFLSGTMTTYPAKIVGTTKGEDEIEKFTLSKKEIMLFPGMVAASVGCYVELLENDSDEALNKAMTELLAQNP